MVNSPERKVAALNGRGLPKSNVICYKTACRSEEDFSSYMAVAVLF